MIAHETGAANTVDPLGGSYFVESLTDEIEAKAQEYFARIDELGGMVAAIEQGFPSARSRTPRSPTRPRSSARSGSWSGSTSTSQRARPTLSLHRPDPGAEIRQKERLSQTKGAREEARVEATLAGLDPPPRRDANLMPAIIECARARVSEGEMVAALQEVFGTYTEHPQF